LDPCGLPFCGTDSTYMLIATTEIIIIFTVQYTIICQILVKHKKTLH